MQLATEGVLVTPAAGPALAETPAAEETRYAQYKVIRRNGSVVGFEPAKISIAMTKAFIAVNGGTGAASARVRVEVALMRAGEHNVARDYVLYREERAKERAKQREAQDRQKRAQQLISVKEGGQAKPLDLEAISTLVREACEGLGREVSAEPILQAMQRDLYDGVPMDEVRKSLVLAARALIEQDPGYSYVTARLLLHSLRLETLGEEVTQGEMQARYAQYLPEFVQRGIAADL